MTKSVVCKEFCTVDQLVVEDGPSRDVHPGDVRIAVKAASVGFMDNLMVQGLYQLKPDLPYTPGACGAGVVIELGEGVEGYKIGDSVSFLNYFGAFATEVVVPATSLFIVPNEMGFAEAAAYRLTYNPAYFALTVRGGLVAGENVLVTGAAGGVGSAAVRVAKALGATVTAVVSTEQKAKQSRIDGADNIIISSELESIQELRSAVKGFTSGQGADVLLDVVGGEVFDELTHCVAPGGRILVMGFASGVIPSLKTNLMLLKNASVVGIFFGGWGIGKNFDAVNRLNRELFALRDSADLGVNISERFTLEEASEALAKVADRSTVGKLIIEP